MASRQFASQSEGYDQAVLVSQLTFAELWRGLVWVAAELR
jgi:hypothetical protein